MSPVSEKAVERWVAKVNRAGREMDEAAASLHPSAWPEALAPHREAFRKLAAQQPKEKAPPPTEPANQLASAEKARLGGGA